MPESLRRMLYLLVLWQERPADSSHPPVWRFRLEDAHSGERQGFASLGDLAAFLQAKIEKRQIVVTKPEPKTRRYQSRGGQNGGRR